MNKVFEQPAARNHYRQRKAMVEPVFAELKERQGLKRFRRRGRVRVAGEFALHCIAYNLKRVIALADAAARKSAAAVAVAVRLCLAVLAAAQPRRLPAPSHRPATAFRTRWAARNSRTALCAA